MAILSNINGKFAVDSTGAIELSGDAGAANEVLVSGGAGAAPTWVAVSTVIGGPYVQISGDTMTGNLTINGSNSLTVGGIGSFNYGTSTTDNVRFYNADGSYAYIRVTADSNNANTWFDTKLGATLWYAWGNSGGTGVTNHWFGTGTATTASSVKIDSGDIYQYNSSAAITNTLNAAGGATFSDDLYIPSYIRHTGDTNTYIGFSGNDTIDLVTDSNVILRIDSSGNSNFAGDVGIGVAATKALQVSGEALFGNGTDGLLLSYSGGNSSGIIDTGHSSTALEFRVGNTQELLINGSSATFAGGIEVNQYIRNTTSNTNSNYIQRDSANTALYVQQRGAGNIVQFQYGAGAIGSATDALTISGTGTSTFAGNVTIDHSANVDSTLKLHAYSSAIADAYAWNLTAENSGNSYAFRILQGTSPVFTVANTASGATLGAATFAGSAQFGQSITMSSTQAEYGYLNLGAASVYGWQIGKAPSSGGIAGNESFYLYNFSNSTVALEVDTSNNATFSGTFSITDDLNVTDSARFEGTTNPITIGDGFGYGGSATICKHNASLYLQYNNGQSATNLYLGGGGTAVTIKDGQNSAFEINSSGVTYFTGGNIGISTTTPQSILSLSKTDESSYTPATAIDYSLMLGTRNGNAAGTSDDLGPGIVWKYNDSGGSYTKKSAGIMQVGEGNYLRSGLAFYTNNNANTTSVWSEKMRLSMDGDLGIGTTSPGSKLEVNGTGQFGGVLRVPAQWDSSSMAGNSIYAATANDGFAFGVGTGISTWWSYSNTSGIRRMIDVDNDGTFVRIRTSQSDRVIVDSTGNVGIRETSPTATLHLGPGGTNQVGIKVQGNSSSTVENILSYNTQAAGTGWYHLVGQYYSGGFANAIIIYGNGNVLNLNNSYGQISDEKLKENISDATPKLEDIKKLKVKNFNFKGDDLKQIGMIAQEVEEVFPGLVEEVTDPKTKEKSKSLKYSVFVPMLIKSIQELEARVKELENK